MNYWFLLFAFFELLSKVKLCGVENFAYKIRFFFIHFCGHFSGIKQAQMSHLLPHKIISFLLQEFPLLSPSSSSLCVKPSFLLYFDQSSPAPSSSVDQHHPHFILLVLFSRPKSSSPRLTELHFFLSASPWPVAITPAFLLIDHHHHHRTSSSSLWAMSCSHVFSSWQW